MDVVSKATGKRVVRAVPATAPPRHGGAVVDARMRIVPAGEVLADPTWHRRESFQVDLVEVSPALATKWAEDEINSDNRPVSDGYVGALVHAIDTQRFYLTHQGIAFDTSGRFGDGQHRLWAVINSGKPIVMMVTRGLAPEAVNVLDQGRSRTAAEGLRRSGVEHGRTLMSWWRVHQYLLRGHTTRASIERVNDFRARCDDAIRWGLSAQPHEGVVRTAPVWGALVFAYPTNPAQVEAFADLLKHDRARARLPKTHAACKLAAVLAVDGATRGGDAIAHEIAVKTLRALQAFIDGQHLQALAKADSAVEYFAKAHADGGYRG